MSFYHAHKKKNRLYSSCKDSSKMGYNGINQARKVIQANLLADYDEWALDRDFDDDYYDDYYDYYDDCDYNCCVDNKEEEQKKYYVPPPTIKLDLWSIHQSKQSTRSKTEAGNTHRDIPVTKHAAKKASISLIKTSPVVPSASTKSNDSFKLPLVNNNNNNNNNNNTPRIVRSNSCHSLFPLNEPANTQPHITKRRSNSLQHTSPPIQSRRGGPNPFWAARCLRALINETLSSVIGPMPRSHIVILSERYQVAVLIIWSTVIKPTALRMLDISDQALSEFQSSLDPLIPKNMKNPPFFSWEEYYGMSLMMHEQRRRWLQILEQTMENLYHSCAQNTATKWNTLVSACAKAGINTGTSLDKFGLLKLWLESRHENRISTTSPLITPKPLIKATTSEDRFCPVCYDEISEEETACQLLECGHFTCPSCWTGYFQSAATSGQCKIQCCIEKCETEVNIFDAAHILHGRDMATFHKLVGFQLEKSVIENARFCPSITCGRTLIASGGEGSQQGQNISICACGNSLCADCPSGTSSHPGISCKEFKTMKNAIDSGKLDAEVANIQWVMRNSRPCPKCRYPIERISGCNHVRCQRCDYYFCWECGGFGNDCMAYSCTKKREYWTKDPSYNEDAHDDMVVLVHKYSSYRRTQRQLKVLSQTISDCSDPLEMKNLVLEHQLQQVLLWAQAANVTKSMNGSKCDPLQPHMKLELLIHALSLRKLIGKSNLKVLELQKIGASGLATMMGMEPRKLSKRKEQAKARIKGKHFTNLARWAGGNNENESFRNLFADQELADLCGMTEVKFVSKTKDTIRDVLETLSFASRIQEIKSTSSKRKNKTKLKGAISGESPLNQRLGKKNEPWRKGYKAESESSSDSSVECVEKNRKCRKKKRTPTWVRYAEHT